MLGDSDALNEPDEDYDAVNDETFGDGVEYNWEQSQRPIESLEKRNNSNGENHRTPAEPQPGGNFEFSDFESSYEGRLKETDYDDFENENALEESISRLVLDEYDEDEEEEKKNKLRRLGGIANYNTYFMPQQVVNKNLHWLIDKDLPGGISLLGSSVWSMHPTSVPPATQSSAPINDTVTPSPSSVIINNAHPVGSKDGQYSNSAGSNLGLLLGLRSDEEPSSMLSPDPPNKPKFRTVDELEKELLKEANEKTPVSQRTTNEIGGNARRPKVMSMEELEREWMEAPIPTPGEWMEAPIPTPGEGKCVQRPLKSGPHAQSGQPAIQPLHSQQAAPPSAATGMPPNNRPPIPPGGLNVSQMMMMRQNMAQQIPHGRQLRNIPHGAFAQNMITSVGMPSPPNMHFNTIQQQQLHFWHMNSQLRNRMPPFNMPFNALAMRQGGQMPPGFLPHNQNFRRAYMNNNLKTEDPFRGLMNEKDKQRLRNIQIIQLQNDHPYPTDYYSLMNLIRNSRLSNPERNRELLSKLFPKKDVDGANKHHYQPAHFENSLGKLQAVSALAPKKAIDTVIRVVDSGPSTRGGPKAYRYLLLEIEKLYECLLNVEEADIRLSLLCNGDDSIVKLRRENAMKIIQVLKSREKVSEYLAVRKGKMLISRLIPLIDTSVRYPVFNHMLKTFGMWASIKNTEIEKAYPYLRHCILTANFGDLLVITNSIDPKMYYYMTKTKLGLSLLVALLHQAEGLLAKSEAGANCGKGTVWNSTARAIAAAILFQENEVAVPTEIFCNMLPHFQRCDLEQPNLVRLAVLWKKWAALGVPVI